MEYMRKVGEKEASGLSRYQELCWIDAVKKYGAGMMTKSLLSQEQKNIILEMVKKDWEYELSV